MSNDFSPKKNVQISTTSNISSEFFNTISLSTSSTLSDSNLLTSSSTDNPSIITNNKTTAMNVVDSSSGSTIENTKKIISNVGDIHQTKFKNILVSPSITQQNSQSALTVSQKNVGSATGNPRNKHALKPGHSLIDWIRLGQSGSDLSGTKGCVIPVSHSELAKHCTLSDAWLAIRGKVYNVTHYVNYHPGGPQELQRGIGKDATKLFEDAHAWVNYEQILAKCFIGPLRNTATINVSSSSSSNTLSTSASTSNKNSKLPSPTNGIFRTPILPFLNTTITKPMGGIGAAAAITSAASTLSSSTMSPPNVVASASAPHISSNNILTGNSNESDEIYEIIPRFDWIQKTTELMIIFYTKSLCNPGVTVHYKSGCDIHVNIFIERTMHLCTFKFAHNVKSPCAIRISNETGKIEIIFKKMEPALWTNFGMLDRRKTTDLNGLTNNEYDVVKRQQINHNSYAIIMKPKENLQQLHPIGYHYSVSIEENGITRSYTPIPFLYLPIVAATDHQSSSSIDDFIQYENIWMAFLIKSYANGGLSRLITIDKPLSDLSLSISQYPKGNFQIYKIKNHTRIGLLAAGSGVTPMLSILDYLLNRTNTKIERITFLYFNKTEGDIWCYDHLKSLELKDKRLRVIHILSEPLDGWSGAKGHISKSITTKLYDKSSIIQIPQSSTSSLSSSSATASASSLSSSLSNIDHVTYCCVCGPTPFNDLALRLLKESGFSDNDLHFFQG